MFRQSGDIILSRGEVYEEKTVSGSLYFRGGKISESVASLTVKGDMFVEVTTRIPGSITCRRVALKADLEVAGNLEALEGITASRSSLSVNGNLRAKTIDVDRTITAGSISCEKAVAGNDIIFVEKMDCRTVSVGGMLKGREISCEEIQADSADINLLDCRNLRIGREARLTDGKFDSASVDGNLVSSGHLDGSLITTEKNAEFNTVKCDTMNVGGNVLAKGKIEVDELKVGSSMECADINANEIIVNESIKSLGKVVATGDIRVGELISADGEIECNTLEAGSEIRARMITCRMNLESGKVLHTQKGAKASMIILGKNCSVTGPIYGDQVVFSRGVQAEDVYAIILHMKNDTSARNVYADEITMWKNSSIKGKCLYRHWIRSMNGMKMDDIGKKVEKLPEFPF
ncbi:MAG: hypothetical protein B2I17_06225 [Thermoplasmatales archaeon B_DKE]|nr:MAG: hypothetical protein B2I17_06225 [Thermoplasmatales archaeon B_DKE]QRF75768.1 putative acyltransferase [Thermoplasmatales archaeon]